MLQGMSGFYTTGATSEEGNLATLEQAAELGVTLLDTAGAVSTASLMDAAVFALSYHALPCAVADPGLSVHLLVQHCCMRNLAAEYGIVSIRHGVNFDVIMGTAGTKSARDELMWTKSLHRRMHGR